MSILSLGLTLGLAASPAVAARACSRAVPPATTVAESSRLRRASSSSTGVTRTGIPPWASIRA